MFAEEEKKYQKDPLKRKQTTDQSFPYREALCQTYQKAGLHASEYAARKKYLSKADEMSRELHDERKSSRNILTRWALIARILGELEYGHGILAEKAGNADDAEKFFKAARDQYVKLNDISKKLATSSELIERVLRYARSFYTLGLALRREGKHKDADEKFRLSKSIREQTLRDYAASGNSANLEIDLWFSQLALGELDAMEKGREQPIYWSRRADFCVSFGDVSLPWPSPRSKSGATAEPRSR